MSVVNGKRCVVNGKRCGICIVGCAGRMGACRVPKVVNNTRARLVALVDFFGEKAKAMAEIHNCTWGTSLEEVLKKDREGPKEIHGVIISSPTPAHAELIKIAAKYGCHVFTEKPVVDEPDECAQLYDLCAEKGVKLCCSFQRRYDAGYIELKEALQRGDIGKPLFITVHFYDHPRCADHVLMEGAGDMVVDMCAHDINYVKWLLGDDDVVECVTQVSASAEKYKAAGVVDIAAFMLTFKSGCIFTMFASRGGTFGYDNRCEVFGETGWLEIKTRPETGFTSATRDGFKRPKMEHSFPERFGEAFQNEVDAFVSIALGDAGVEWANPRDDVIWTMNCAQRTSKAGKLGITLPMVPAPLFHSAPVGLRFLGAGNFGTYMISTCPESFTQLQPYTRKSGLSWEKDVLEDKATRAVYVCTPDKLHQAHAIACLQAGKHVLCEKSVGPSYAAVEKAAVAAGKVMMVGFDRRYYSETHRVQSHMKAYGFPKILRLESYDACPVTPDPPGMGFVLHNSCSHDIDFINFVLPDAEITWESGSVKLGPNEIKLQGTAKHKDGSSTRLEIDFHKDHPTYVNRILVDGINFGFDVTPPFPVADKMCSVYAGAYEAQWAEFRLQIGRLESVNPMVSAAAKEFQRAQGASYLRTFASLDQAQKVLGLGSAFA